jgi:hypothetical protein
MTPAVGLTPGVSVGRLGGREKGEEVYSTEQEQEESADCRLQYLGGGSYRFFMFNQNCLKIFFVSVNIQGLRTRGLQNM